MGSNPAYTACELSHLFSLTDTKFVIVEPDLLKNVLPVVQERCMPESNLLIFNTDERHCLDGFDSWDTLLNHGERDWHVFENGKDSESTTAALMSTSGTTGLSKAAAISHYALVAQNIMYYDSKEKPYKVCRYLAIK